MLGSIVAGEGSGGAPKSSSRSGSRAALGGDSAPAGGVTNGYDHPNRLGADRWVALIGARHLVLSRGPARPALVVMVGTAVTVDALDAEAAFSAA